MTGERGLNALYEGEIDCGTWGHPNPTPHGFGRLLAQDTVKNTALNSYVGYFDRNIEPTIYQYDRILLRDTYDRPDNLMSMERKTDDGENESFHNYNLRNREPKHTCMRSRFDFDTKESSFDMGYEECKFETPIGDTDGPDDYTSQLLGIFYPHICEVFPDQDFYDGIRNLADCGSG